MRFRELARSLKYSEFRILLRFDFLRIRAWLPRGLLCKDLFHSSSLILVVRHGQPRANMSCVLKLVRQTLIASRRKRYFNSANLFHDDHGMGNGLRHTFNAYCGSSLSICDVGMMQNSNPRLHYQHSLERVMQRYSMSNKMRSEFIRLLGLSEYPAPDARRLHEAWTNYQVEPSYSGSEHVLRVVTDPGNCDSSSDYEVVSHESGTSFKENASSPRSGTSFKCSKSTSGSGTSFEYSTQSSQGASNISRSDHHQDSTQNHSPLDELPGAYC